MVKDLVSHRAWQALMVVGPLTSMLVNPWSNYDPISVVKMCSVVTIAFMLLGIFISEKRILGLKENMTLIVSSGFFVTWLVVTFLFSGAPFDQQFWGYFGRNTGLLTYLSLIIILLAAAGLRQTFYFRQLDSSLLYASMPIASYCVFQIMGRDPVNWSQFDVFGTLGNVNFLSGFLGLVCVSIFAKIFTKPLGWKNFLLVGLLIAYFGIIASSKSIQGFVIFAVGAVVVTYFRLGTLQISKLLRTLLVLLVSLFGYISVQGLFNKGLLAGFLYQPSNVLRADYMHAGWQMTTDHPFFGVGLDSYGDWYRQARGEITTLRGSPDRNSNAAHSVFLDISSNGGFPLLVAYIAILLVIFVRCLKAIKKQGKTYDPIFVSLFSVWVAFHFQSFISINQIGVGVWGWIVGGALFGYSTLVCSQAEVSGKFVSKKFKGKLIPAKTNIAMFLSTAIGVILAVIPQQADSRYFAATKTGQFTTVEKAAISIGSTAWHRNLLLDAAMASQDSVSARRISYDAIARYPRNFWAWKVLWVLPDSTVEERTKALDKLRELDPFNPEFVNP